MKNKSILLLNIYWIFSIVYYCFGKWQWNIPSYIILLAYVALNYIFLNVGYRFCNVSAFSEIDADTLGPLENPISQFKKYRTLFTIACILTIIFEVSWVITFLGEFSIFDVFDKLGENYYERMEAEFDSPVLIMQIRTLLWIFTYFAYPIGFMFFKEMAWPFKVLFIVTVIIEVLASLNVGVSKNIGDLVIILIATLLLRTHSQSAKKINPAEQAKKKKLIFRISALLVVFLIAFSTVQSLRAGASDVVNNPYGKFAQIRDHSLFDIFFGKNSSITSALDSLGVYCSHGYTGLAYALTIPFESTNGIGFSTALMQYMESYLGIPSPASHTYNYRIFSEFGWKNGQWWPTAFVWIGNAISLWLVPISMFFLGSLFRKAECRWKSKKQLLSLVMYCQLFIAMIYLPCNAQIVQGRQALIATALLFVMYFLAYGPLRKKGRIRT